MHDAAAQFVSVRPNVGNGGKKQQSVESLEGFYAATLTDFLCVFEEVFFFYFTANFDEVSQHLQSWTVLLLRKV